MSEIADDVVSGAEIQRDTPPEEPGAFPRSTGLVAEATEILGLLNDPRWAQYVEPLLREYGARRRLQAERAPATLDGAFERQHHCGAVECVEKIMALFTALRSRCERTVFQATGALAPEQGTATRPQEKVKWWNPIRGSRGKVGKVRRK